MNAEENVVGSDEPKYIIAEWKPDRDAEDPYLILRKPVIDHPGICHECGYDVCLQAGLHNLSTSDTLNEKNDTVFSRDDPWERIDPDIQKRIKADLARHTVEVHNRFSKRVVTASELPVQNLGEKQITAAERRATDAKNKRAAVLRKEKEK